MKKDNLINEVVNGVVEQKTDLGASPIVAPIPVTEEIKPITPEDAILKLQEKPADRFLTFINSETNKVNVLFKLKDSKNYGIVEPDI